MTRRGQDDNYSHLDVKRAFGLCGNLEVKLVAKPISA